MDVICFYNYSSIEGLLLSKHTKYGYRVYKELGKKVLYPFMVEFCEHELGDIYLIGIDEKPTNGYSHIATLTHTAKMPTIIPYHSKLIDYSGISYAGKSLEYRLNNPREFRYSGKSNIQAILIDDIITTGTTLQYAKDVLIKADVEVLFALCLADARE
jgi:competence protein ComFC